MTSDPIGLGGGLNPYLYANANSIRYFDPLGLDAVITGEWAEGGDPTARVLGNSGYEYGHPTADPRLFIDGELTLTVKCIRKDCEGKITNEWKATYSTPVRYDTLPLDPGYLGSANEEAKVALSYFNKLLRNSGAFEADPTDICIRGWVWGLYENPIN